VLNTYEDSDRVTAQKLADDSTFRFAYTAMNGKTIQTEVTDRRGANLASNGTNQYTWNVQDLLAGIDGAETASFSYDMSGRRRDQTVNGHRTQSYWLGDELNFMVRENDWDHRMRVFSPYPASGPDELTYRRLGEDAGEDRYALRDGNNNVIALTDTDQRIRTQYSYELYGRTKLTGDDDVNAQQYTARENDGDGLYYYRGRYYSPSIGRFISEDPVGYGSGQTNAYAYVGGNPVSYGDPSGLQVPFPYTPVPPPSGAGSNTPSWVSPPWGAQGLVTGSGIPLAGYSQTVTPMTALFIRTTRKKRRGTLSLFVERAEKNVLMMVLFGRKTRRAMAGTNGSAGRARKAGAKEGRQIVFGLMDAFENEGGRNGVVQIQ
jgi:RHS repeat-associated protein